MSVNSKVNFIQHLLAISHKFIADSRLSPWHISLYYALFQNWNQAKFNNPVSISRSELMGASKIGSANTYTKCLRELDAWGYLKYNPSFNPQLGSLVYMYTFDKGSDKGTDKGSDKASVIAVIPYINSINNLNNINKRKRENNHSLVNETSNEKSEKKISVSTKTSIPKKRKKVPAAAGIPSGGRGIKAKKEIKLPKPSDRAACPEPAEGESRTGATKTSYPSVQGRERPLLQQVLQYFKEKAWPEVEAQKYYHHYQSNGWLVGGKTPMSDWQASAEKWMLNSNEFKKTNVTPSVVEGPKPNNLNIPTNKNYNEPL